MAKNQLHFVCGYETVNLIQSVTSNKRRAKLGEEV